MSPPTPPQPRDGIESGCGDHHGLSTTNGGQAAGFTQRFSEHAIRTTCRSIWHWRGRAGHRRRPAPGRLVAYAQRCMIKQGAVKVDGELDDGEGPHRCHTDTAVCRSASAVCPGDREVGRHLWRRPGVTTLRSPGQAPRRHRRTTTIADEDAVRFLGCRATVMRSLRGVPGRRLLAGC